MTLPLPPLLDDDGRLDPVAVQYAVEQVQLNWPSQYKTLGKAVGAFSVYRATSKTGIVTATPTKIDGWTEEYDYSGWFASDKYTPKMAGPYSFNAAAHLLALGDGKSLTLSLYKNGALHAVLANPTVGAAVDVTAAGKCEVEANGSTDYFEVYVTHNHGANRDIYGQALPGLYTYFQGHYVGGKP